MIHECRQEGEECNAVKEMPISLWIPHLIKNTAADTSARRGIRRKGKVETGTKREGTVVVIKGALAELDEITSFSRQKRGIVTYWGGPRRGSGRLTV